MKNEAVSAAQKQPRDKEKKCFRFRAFQGWQKPRSNVQKVVGAC